MTVATQAARAELKNGASICIGVALLGFVRKISYPNDPAVKYPHKLRRIFIEGMGGELQGISSEYVFAASCAQAFKRRKVKANRLKSESINSRAIGKLCSVAK